MKQYPGMAIDGILARDSTVEPFTRLESWPRCRPLVFLNGKSLPVLFHNHGIHPDMEIRSWVKMKDVAVIEVYQFARRSDILEPWIPRDMGTGCHAAILIWTKDFKQRPYTGN
ncbi:MAG TPA: hypothetical protein VFK16_02540 [Gemmatimonadaceae bacterium]|nr:hypothetical protein [Gemmatimonadaceae bacterium]